MILRSVVLILLFATSWLAQGDQFELSSAWARAPAPGAQSLAIYGVFRNKSAIPWTIARFESDVARKIMLHRSTLKGGMMSMSAVDEFVIPAGGSVALEPGGLHLMVMGLSSSLEEGETFGLNIISMKGDVISAKVLIGSIAQMTAPR